MSELFPISAEAFNLQFIKMASLLNRTVNKDQMEHWYSKVKLFQLSYVEETVDVFVELGKFPIWSDFRKAYRRVEAVHEEKKAVGCEYCTNGFIHHWDKPKMYGGKLDIQYSDRCKLCNPDRFGYGYDGHMNPKNRRIIDFSSPYPHGRQGMNEPPPLKPSVSIDGKELTKPWEASKSAMKELIADAGVQVNVPEKKQEFQRKNSLEEDFERDIKSERESSKEFPWF